jgi:hypothetical protein
MLFVVIFFSCYILLSPSRSVDFEEAEKEEGRKACSLEEISSQKR